MSGKAVEAAGDVHTLLLDKTGTITVGNRQATAFIPLAYVRTSDLVEAAYLGSSFDTTPEGRTVVAFAQTSSRRSLRLAEGALPLDFSAETRMSGVDLHDGRIVRKGAVEAVVRHVKQRFGAPEPPDLREIADGVARAGATPLAVSVDGRSLVLSRCRTFRSPAFASVCSSFAKWASIRLWSPETIR